MRLFGEYGIAFDREVYQRTYSPNWYHTFRCLGLPEERWAEADERWLSFFAEEPVDLLPGAREALLRLVEEDVVRGIVTSGSRGRVSRELVAHGLDGVFHDVVFGSDAAEKKPHPAALHLALDRLGLSSHEAAYIGDSPEDVQMAKAANVTAVAVPGSYPNREALAASEPDVFADDLAEAVTRLLGF